jgi:O-antigen chain-terminating methyltransferase
MVKLAIVSGANGAGKSTFLNELSKVGGFLIFDCDSESRPHAGHEHIKNSLWHLSVVKDRMEKGIEAAKAGKSAVVSGLISPDELLSLGYNLSSDLFAFVVLQVEDEMVFSRLLESGKIGSKENPLAKFMLRRKKWLTERFRQETNALYVNTSQLSPSEALSAVLSWLKSLPTYRPVMSYRLWGVEPTQKSEEPKAPAGTEYHPKDKNFGNAVVLMPEVSIQELVSSVEPYQPLYRAPELHQKKVQRIAYDRAWAIENTMPEPFAGKRILDIGCALGFFSLYFADKGASGVGYDVEPANVQICNYLAAKLRLDARFFVAMIGKDDLDNLMPLQYDVAFLLSVAHHICNSKGLAYAQNFVRALTTKVRHCFIELAIAEEEVKFAWRAKLPKDPMEFFSTCSNVKIQEIGRFSVHISPVKRPLYYVTWSS